ncbi:hypothetical protein [Kitasatospora sp. NPDC085879]|uniref:hypothetical protein n=1 Tax=Kitasatospora sp. NPDC085879 TaxID=3154769 RepID=UPI003424BD63
MQRWFVPKAVVPWAEVDALYDEQHGAGIRGDARSVRSNSIGIGHTLGYGMVKFHTVS